MAKAKLLAWMDLETTGSKLHNNRLMEAALVITTPDLEQELWGVTVVVGFGGSAMDFWREEADPVVREMHDANGLWKACDESTLALEVVDALLADALHKFGKPHDFLLAGSGVSHFDRKWIDRDLPATARYLQYGALDIGVLRRSLWAFGLDHLVPPAGESKTKTHRAYDDILVHINEAKHYKRLLETIHV